MIKTSMEAFLDKVDQHTDPTLQGIPEGIERSTPNEQGIFIDAAYKACDFFGYPRLPIKEGSDTRIIYGDKHLYGDSREYLEYSPTQFQNMGWNTFDEQSKVWTHEIGHAIMQGEIFSSPWASELGADFFVGVRAEMMGLPFGLFEESIGNTIASSSHPDGKIRLEAMQLGRDYATYMHKSGKYPTWKSCTDAFKESRFANIDYYANKDGLRNGSSHFHESWAASKLKDSQKYLEWATTADDIHEREHYSQLAKDYERASKLESELAKIAKDISFTGFYEDKLKKANDEMVESMKKIANPRSSARDIKDAIRTYESSSKSYDFYKTCKIEADGREKMWEIISRH